MRRYEAGLLQEDERAELVAEWREQFEKAQAAGFWFCLGSGRSLKGAPARRAHYKWADIPPKLVRQRRKRGKTIHELEAAALL